MSNDYRPRGGGGSRRRRGGQGQRGNNRPQQQQRRDRGEHKPVSPIKKLVGWLFNKNRSKLGTADSGDRNASHNNNNNRPRRSQGPRENTPTAPVEVTTPKLYVGNLSYDAGEGDLFDLFSKVGAVRNVEVVMDRNRRQSKGFGFVEMETIDSAKTAVEQLNRTDFMGRQIVVSGAKSERRTSTSESEAPSQVD
jgi:RNA recognition motif-containing protein